MKKLFVALFVISIAITIGFWFVSTGPVWIDFFGGHASYDLPEGVGILLTGMTGIPVLMGWYASWELFVASSDK